jgi:hypothetical protein
MWIGVVIVWFVLSILAGVGARNKGRSFAGFFFLSLLLSPLVGLIAMAVAKPAEKKAEEAPEQPVATVETPREIPCPNCGKPKVSGSMCQSCGSWAG